MSKPKPILLHGRPVSGSVPADLRAARGPRPGRVLAEVDVVFPKRPDVLDGGPNFSRRSTTPRTSSTLRAPFATRSGRFP